MVNSLATISSSKCNLLELGHSDSYHPFNLSFTPLNYNKSTLDLGVTIEQNLKFQQHINQITHRVMIRVNQRANLIHHCFTSKNTANLARAFKTYVRPLLEYASPVWSPYTKCQIESIEAVQQSFTRCIPGIQQLSYSKRLQALNLQTLEHRRLLTDLTTCYNIVHGLSSLTFDNFFSYIPNTFNTRGHSLKLSIPLDLSNTRKYFFSSRVVKPWNALPYEVVISSTTSQFKSKISNIDMSSFLNFPCIQLKP